MFETVLKCVFAKFIFLNSVIFLYQEGLEDSKRVRENLFFEIFYSLDCTDLLYFTGQYSANIKRDKHVFFITFHKIS